MGFRSLIKYLLVFIFILFFSLGFSFADDVEDSFNLDLSENSTCITQDIGSVSSDVLVDDDGAVDDSDEWVDNFEEDSTDDWEDVDYDAGRIDFPDRGDDRVASHFVASSFSKYYRNGTQLVGYLMDSDDNPIVGRNVSIGINNNVYYKITDETGMFLLNINLRPRNYTTVIDFAGDETYAPCSKTILIKVFTMPTSILASNLVKYYKDDSQLVARLLDTHGNPLSGHNVTISIANVDYIKTTDDDGYAYLNINLQPSVRNATINFTENGYKSSKKVVSVTVNVMPISLTSENVIKHYRNGTQWIARLLDVYGNPLANKTLVFNVASNDYIKTTDDDGYAYLDINLRPSTRNGIVSFNAPYYYNSSKTVTITVLDPPAPLVTPEDGFYNLSSMSVNLTAYHENATVFCSFDNGTSWYNNTGNLCFNLSCGNWTISSYVGWNGYNSSIISSNYLIDYNAPVVWASQGSAIYDESFDVNLSALDDADDFPLIFYTLDGSLPDENSYLYTNPIFISNSSSVTTLRFVAMDCFGRKGSVVNVHYFFGDLVANLNNGKFFVSLQDAIDDNETFEGDIIEVSKDLNENVLLNKSVYLRSCDFKDIVWEVDNDLSSIVFDSVTGAIVEGFVFKSNSSSCMVFDNSSNCFIVDNLFFSFGHSAIMDYHDSDNLSSYKNVSFSNHILYNDFYGGDICIELANSLNYSICGNDFSKHNNSLLNSFNVSSNSLIHNVAILAHESDNSLFEENHFYDMEIMGVCLDDGSNDFFLNNSFSQCNVSVDLDGVDICLKNNNFSNNIYGIMIRGGNNKIISNFVMNNDYGVFSLNSTNLSVNFNRIVDNAYFGLYVLDGCVNATNNWWGSNNPTAGIDVGCDVYYCENLGVIYEPYLIISTYVSSFRKNQLETNIYDGNEIILNYSLSEAICIADLRKNNFGEDISYLGALPDDTILFVQYNPFIHGHRVSLVSGLANYSTPKGIGDGIVLIYFDNEYKILNIYDVHDETNFYFETSGIIIDANSSSRYYKGNLTSNVVWVSFIWKYVGDFRTEFNLILNGNIVDNFTVESSFYHENKYNFSDNVWNAMELYNDFLYNSLSESRAWVYVCIALDYGLNTFDDVEYKYYNGTWRDYSPELKDNLTVNGTLFNATLLSLIEDRYNLTSDEIDFVFNSHLEVRDTVSVGFSYLGNDEEIFSFDLGNSTETFPFTGSCSFRTAEISCVNGAYAHMVGNNATEYEETWTNVHYQNGTIEWENGYNYGYYANAWYDGLMTFTFANDKVDNDVLAYWLNESNRTDANGSLVYGVGPMKAAYGSFLEALLVIYMDDLVADAAAERYNVTWTRISPMVMSVHDYVLDTYMTGECDFYFGREAYGNLDNVKAFYFACSASFSLIERYVGESLFPGSSDLGAVTTGLGYILEHNGTLEIFIQDGVVLIREEGSNDRVLIFDSETGLLHDAFYDFNGAFCYSNQQTDWALCLGFELLGYSNPIWAYLLDLGDLPDLSRPTGSMLKSCNFFLGMGALFVVEGAEVAAYLGGLTASLGEASIVAVAAPMVIVAATILVFTIQPVGEEDGWVDNYWSSHNLSDNPESISSNNDIVQIKKKNKNGNHFKKPKYPIDFTMQAPYSPGISIGFYISNSGPDDDNTSLIIKVTAGALISMLIAPGGLFAASSIQDNINLTLEYDKEKDEYTITLLNYEWGVSNV